MSAIAAKGVSGGDPGGAPDTAAGIHRLVPAGTPLIPDRGTRLVANGMVLVGGSPVRVLRLTPAGARQVAGWFAGAPVPAGAGARALARKLLDAGIAHPDIAAPGAFLAGPGAATSQPSDGQGGAVPLADTPGYPTPADVTVVIPVRDRHAELARCLAGLRDLPHVIVVDDASADPGAIKRIAAEHGAAVIRRPVNGGPGAARNTGLNAADTDIVAFLDSDCVPRPGWLDGLLPHFADLAVGAVAPRIVPHENGTGWLARYEGASSTLDMGVRPSPVRPGARVSYVPGAALVIRKAAAGDGFRDGMYVGEDVDFIWRMSASGWRVRYEPAALMGHDHRVTFRAWFSRRADYGTSAAALEELHPGAVRPLYASWWTAGAWAAALSGRPGAAVALTGTATALLARRLSRVTGERWPVPSSRVMADVRAPHRVPERPLSGPLPDNSKKRNGGRRLSVIVDYWARHRVPSHPLSAPLCDNSKKRSRSVLPRGGAAWRLALRLAGGGTVAAARPLGSAMSRTWWPAAIPAALAVKRLRVPVAALILAPPLLDWTGRRPPLDPARYVAARLLDDVAYSLGVWQGCLARRTVRPLLPVVGGKRQPG